MGIVPFQPPTFLYDLSKIPVDDAPGGFGICLRPRRCGNPNCDIPRTGNAL
jgi:hypothetical protein